MNNTTAPETVTIDGWTYERPTRRDRRMIYGEATGRLVTWASPAGGGTGRFLTPSKAVFAAFSIDPDDEAPTAEWTAFMNGCGPQPTR